MRARRIDTTARDLTAYAEDLGLRVMTINGVIDAWVWLPGPRDIYAPVDWKSRGGTLTPAQIKLVAAGWRIEFLTTPEQVEALVRRMKREQEWGMR